MPDDQRESTRPATAVRHLRFPVDAWRRAAARSKREGHGVAAVAVALLVAYADGRIDHPDHHHPADADHPPTTTTTTESSPTSTAEKAPTSDGIVRRGARRPNGSGKHTTRGFRIADDLWTAGLEAAHAQGVTLASRLVRAVEDLVAEGERR